MLKKYHAFEKIRVIFTNFKMPLNPATLEAMQVLSASTGAVSADEL